MSVICPCGRRATHRIRWNEWVNATEPSKSKAPSRCLECAIRDARLDTEARRQRQEYEREFNPLLRQVFRSQTQVPHQWCRFARTMVKRHAEVINPGGLVEVYQRNRHLYVELYPPRERPPAWRSDNCLYILRYLMKRPVVFLRVDTSDSPSPTTRRESREQWDATLPAVVAPSPNTVKPE